MADKTTYIIADAPSQLPPRCHLSERMRKAASAQQITVSADAFDARGKLHPDALDVISEVMSHGGTVLVDLPAAAREATAFTAFAQAVMGKTAAKAGRDHHTGKLLFAGAVDAPLIVSTPSSGHRR